LNSETAGRVKESWVALRGREGRLAGAFYDRLFELDGDLRDLFVVTYLEAMREKLVMTLDLIVDQLTDTGRLSTRLEAAARSHALYGIGRREYRMGGEALLWGGLGRGLHPRGRADAPGR
jgi:hemoglobin-like flavoprotein